MLIISQSALAKDEPYHISESISSTVIVRTHFIDKGSGFFIDDDLVMTAFHVVAGYTSAQIEKKDGTTCAALVKGIDEGQDLAVLRVNCTGKPLVIASYARLGDDVYAIGSPPPLYFAITKGIYSADNSQGSFDYMVANVYANNGSSGGPVLNERGEVVGVVKGKFKEMQWFIAAVKYDDVQRFIDRTGLLRR